jgi:chromosome segregation protein
VYLKRLEVKGFKTFAEHTEINLEPGINIIVGPNGCGKSNIVDAIRWVLGEANVRHLRGHRNEDVIFNGTDKRKALGLAQVDMTVDNSDGTLPLDYSEVTVSRKMFRSGESEFYLNKARVRMKDVVSLYTDTGLGKRGYSIISQGELERVLNGQPFDRRLMLEEAAGTVRYRQQRDEVQQRILTTTQDLARVGDILSELGIRKDELHGKAERAKTSQAIGEDYRDLEKQVMAYQINECNDNLQAKRSELALRMASLKSIKDRQNDLHTSLKATELCLEQKRICLNEAKESRYGIEAELSRMESEIKLNQERIQNHQERLETAGIDSHKYALLLEKLEQDLLVKIADFNREKNQYQERGRDVELLCQEINRLERTVEEHEVLFQKQGQLVFEQVNRESELKNEITGLELKIRKAQEKRERLFIRAEDKAEQLKSSQRRIKELQTQARQHSCQREDSVSLLAHDEVKRQELISSQSTLEQELQQINRHIINVEPRLAVLKDLQRTYAGYSEGVKAVLKSCDRGDKNLEGIKGLVAQLVEVPPDLGRAIDIALGKGSENIVVETVQSARKVIQFLKQQRLGRVTLLPLDILRVQKIPSRVKEELIIEEGVLGIASELIKYETKYDKAVSYLLGRVLLVQDMACGLRVFKKNRYPLRIVSLEGEVINTSGAMTGGTASPRQASPLIRKLEEDNLSKQLLELRRTEAANREAASIIAPQVKTIEERLAQRNNILAEIDFQAKIIRDEEQRIQAVLEDATLERDIYMQEISQLEAFIAQSEGEILAFHEQHQFIREENSQVSNEIEAIKAKLENLRREYEVYKERYSSHQEQLIMKGIELESLERNIAQFDQVKQSYQQSGFEIKALQERLEKEVSLHIDKVESTTRMLDGKRQELINIVESISTILKDEQGVSKDIERLRSSLNPVQQQLIDCQDQIRSMEMRLVRQDTELEVLVAQWTEKYESENPEVYRKDLSQRQIREYRNQIEILRAQLESLGSIDIDSIKEYDELKLRYDFLYQQIQDLSTAKVSLEKLLKETEKIMVKNFSQFMALAFESFKRTFVEIFNGGDASLQFDPSSDLNSGVDIVVKMPGKRSQSLNLLSGGERALTCIAFIFSLLRLKPAPFCLLDEIDASLDETNLIRFAEFLQKMSSETQFIVITHRQVTIEAGNNIYGITMPQEGISSVLSLHCDEIQSLAG